MPKSWSEKFLHPENPQVKKLEKSFADMPEGCMMLIATPKIIDQYVNNIPKGTSVSIPTLRNDLATTFHADKTCPLTTGIFLRIVAEKAYEEYLGGKALTAITPFWRVITPGTPLAKKLSCGEDFLKERRSAENLPLR